MRRWGRVVLALGMLALAAAPAGAQPRASADRADWRGTGVVLKVLPPPSELHATRPVIVIQHEPIAGLMDDAMAMPFIAASTALFQGLRAGDHVAFGLRETPGALLVISIQKMPPER
ncbi:MAG TPA: copper-binding protein [Methylomirabilota bacterium]|nr:copper-binding protein [Methylomirabilota bacterium]